MIASTFTTRDLDALYEVLDLPSPLRSISVDAIYTFIFHAHSLIANLQSVLKTRPSTSTSGTHETGPEDLDREGNVKGQEDEMAKLRVLTAKAVTAIQRARDAIARLVNDPETETTPPATDIIDSMIDAVSGYTGMMADYFLGPSHRAGENQVAHHLQLAIRCSFKGRVARFQHPDQASRDGGRGGK